MKECPYCHKDIPDDSAYCYHCGKELSHFEKKKDEVNRLKQNPHKNSWAKLGIMLFFIALIVFDFILGTVISNMGGNEKIPYYISSFIYIVAMFCGFMSLHLDKQDEKKGYQPNGNKNYAYVSIFLSIFIMLVNISQVILK